MWFSKIKNQNHQQGPSKSKARLARSFFPFAMRSSVAPPLLIFSFSVLLSIFSCSSDDTTFNGAALGYWMVRKFVIAEDGSVDVGVAQFVKWAMRVIAATFIFLVAMAFMLINSVIMLHLHISGPNGHQVLLILLWQWGHWLLVCQSAFLSLPSSGMVQTGQGWWLHGEHCGTAQGDLLVGLTLLLKYDISDNWEGDEKSARLLSTFHRTPNRKKFSKKEWENFTQESTRHAVAELASFPKFTD
ncbi:uncharacterized protein LOC114264419 isoform X3 [Camellia sinensis]|uniref:uncharacterized protein LOC114264419 isoform X3 n=1 Tax=Camellia sinensis TaxID=4442 RepID=UPI00103693A4|nr:uncharacterized protein LOC114264419 isoform X3 [Camellia sinensis]